MLKTSLVQTIQFSIQKYSHFEQFRLAKVHSLNFKTVLFQASEFSISAQFCSIWSKDATTPGQSGHWSDSNEGLLRILKNSSITGTSPSDCLVSYPCWGASYLFEEVQSVYSTAPADWVRYEILILLLSCLSVIFSSFYAHMNISK